MGISIKPVLLYGAVLRNSINLPNTITQVFYQKNNRIPRILPFISNFVRVEHIYDQFRVGEVVPRYKEEYEINAEGKWVVKGTNKSARWVELAFDEWLFMTKISSNRQLFLLNAGKVENGDAYYLAFGRFMEAKKNLELKEILEYYTKEEEENIQRIADEFFDIFNFKKEKMAWRYTEIAFE